MIDLALLAQLIGPPCGAIVAASVAADHISARWMYSRALDRWLAASEADRKLLGPMPEPPKIGTGGAAALILAFLLAVGLPFATGTAHPIDTLTRLGVLSAADPMAQGLPGDFEPDTRRRGLPSGMIGQ